MSPTISRFNQVHKVASLVDGATINVDCDTVEIGALILTQNCTIGNPTGNPVEGQFLLLRIKSASSFTLAFGANYEAASSLTLPPATTGSNAVDEIGFRYSAVKTKWIFDATTIGAVAGASTALDSISSIQGDILYRGSSGWVALGTGTAGQVLQTNGAAANPSWVTPSDGYEIVKKTSDESRTTTTTNSSDGELLTPSLVINKNYLIQMDLIVTGTAAAGGVKGQWSLPAGASIAGNWSSSTATANVNQPTSASVNICTAANQDALQYHKFFGCLIMGGTSGAVTFQWAQATSGAAVTIKAGSELKYKLGN